MSMPSEYKAKLLAAGNFSLKQREKTSKLVNFTLKFQGKKHCPFCLQYMPSNNNSVLLPGSNAGPMNYKANTIIYRCSWEIKELLHIISLNLEGLSGFN